ncbi:MAG: winged helix-turn-helix domain-containing protein [Rudaea sp.]|nr:winged helix-turn-helix domain-containing protein [Rudaea sp.]
MAHKAVTGTASDRVEDAKKIAVLAAPVRIEIVSTLEAMGGTATVAALAGQLGRPADGLYYHLRALLRAGLIEEQPGSGHGRCYRVPSARGLRLRYKPGATANAKAVGRVAASISRLAQRDFARALSHAGTVVEGPQRELWAVRLRGWVDATELAEINQLLLKLVELFLRSRPKPASKLVALQWILAPIDAKPARRAVADKSATRRRSR